MANSTVAVRFTGDADNLNRTMRGVEDSTGRLHDRMRTFATGIAGAIGGAFAVGAVVDFGGQMLALGGQLETMRAKVDTVFGAAADSIREWADSNNEAFGVTDDQLAGMAASMGDLLKPMGFTAEQAASMSQEMVGLSGALSSWSGGTRSAAEVSEILQAALLGETDSLQGLGIAISAADIEARLAAQGQADLTGEARKQAEALAIQALIFESSTDAQAAWAAGGSEAMAAQNSLSASIGELKEKLATALTPALTEVAAWVGEHLPMAMAAASDFMNTTLRPAFEAIVGWVRENWPQIQATITEVFAQVQTIVSGFVGFVMAAWNAFGDNILGAVERVWPIIRQNIEGVLNVIRGIIQTVTSLIKGDWSGVWEGIKEILLGVWDIIVSRVRLAIEAVKLVITTTLDALRAAWRIGWDAMREVVSGIWDGMVGAFQGVINGVIGGLEWGINRAIDLVNGAINALDTVLGPFINFGEIGHVNLPRIGGSVSSAPSGPGIIHAFDSGGRVPGPPGLAQLVLAHGAETILPTHRMGFDDAVAAVGGGGMTDEFIDRFMAAFLVTAERAARANRQFARAS